MIQKVHSPTLHRIALATAIATFPLIFMGGLVTSHGAGMSVPDWPNSYGYNMFTFPPSKWIGGIFYEHTHRLMGTVVGMLSIALVVAAWMLDSRKSVRWLTGAMLLAVIAQGVLGGLRVLKVNLDLAIIHACFAQAVFCLATSAAIVTSKWWLTTPIVAPAFQPAARRVFAVAVACVFAVYLQLVVGAIMRHEKAGLAIPDLPLAYGKVLPPMSADDMNAINKARAWTYQLDPVSMTQVWLHFGHRIGAIVASTFAIWLSWTTWRRFRTESHLARPAITLLMLIVAQLTLGVLTVLQRKPADIASAHVACGALVLVTSFVIAMRSMRLFMAREAIAQRDETSIEARPLGNLVAA